MKYAGGGFLCVALLLAGCASDTGATPGSVAGTWLFQVLSSGCPDITGIANGADDLPTEVFQVIQVGNQVSAQFVDNGGNNCSLDGTYHPDEFRGTLRVDDGEVRTVIFSVEGFARDFGGRRQVDGWARVQQDTAGQCVGEIIEFCAIIQSGEITPQPPSVFFIEPGDDVCVVEGTDVQIIYVDDDLDSQASTSLFADRDGDLLTTEDQVVIAAGRAENNGVTQILDWDTTGVIPAAYTIHAVTTDGQFTANATALGTVEVLCDIPIDLVFARGIQSVGGFLDAHAVAAFDDGSFVVAGGFIGTATFGAGEANETVMTSAGDAEEDPYVARYNADGSLRWVVGAEAGSEQDLATGVVTYPDGSCVVSGWFTQEIDFGSGTVSNGNSSRDPFVVRFDADGNTLWTSIGSSGPSSRSDAITALPDGGCVITGCFEGGLTFGDGEPNETTVFNVGGDDIFVARFDADGALVYAVQLGNTADEDPGGIAGFPDGSVVVAGEFNGTTEIGPETFTSADPSGDMFVARLDGNGSVVWVRFGSGEKAEALAATALLDGSVVVSGQYQNATFGPGGADEVTLTSVPGDGDDAFVMRLTSDGTILWARSAGGPGDDEGEGVASFPDGSVIVTGEINDVVTFGAGELNETTFASRGEEDIFYAHYGADGNLIWACRDGGAGRDEGHAVATFPDGSFVVGARAENEPATFGKGDPNETVLSGQIPIVRYEGAPVGPPLQPPITGGGMTDAQILAECRVVDIVFIVDTSLSMIDDAAALNTVLPQVVSQLQALAATEGGSFIVNSTILGITETGVQARARIQSDIDFFNSLLPPQLQIPDLIGNEFDFINDSVLARLGGNVPPSQSLSFADPIDAGPLGFGFESWASGTAIVADRFSWSFDGVRIASAIGDEGPEEGLSGEMFTVPVPPFPTINIADRGDCDQMDTDATTNAIRIAGRNNVIVSPITGFLQDSIAQLLGEPGSFNTCAVTEGQRLADGTGGVRLSVQDPVNDMAQALSDLILDACRRSVEAGVGFDRLIAFDRDGHLYNVNPYTGQDTLLINTSLGAGNVGVVSSALFNQQTNQLWLGLGNDGCQGCITTLDFFTGQATILFDNANTNAHPGMAQRASDGQVFGTSSASGDLLAIDSGGQAALLGNLSNVTGGGRALTFVDGTLYLAADDTLFVVDPGAVGATPVGTFNLVGFPPLSRLSVNSMTTSSAGVIFAIVTEAVSGADDPSYLAKIDPETAEVTNIGQLDNRLDGLTFVPRAQIDEALLGS